MVAVPVMKATKNSGVHTRQSRSMYEAVGHSCESGHSYESVCLRGFCKNIGNDVAWTWVGLILEVSARAEETTFVTDSVANFATYL